MHSPTNKRRQSGMAMFVSLVMLLLMSLVILASARSSLLELFLGNNAQHIAQSLMRAEDSVTTGETHIEENYSGPPSDYQEGGGNGVYLAGEIDINNVDWSYYGARREGEGDNYREWIIEYLGPVSATGGSISVGAGAASDTRYLYRVSGRGESTRGSTRVVQTIYATAE